MESPYASLRGTGRTTRMLREVLKIALADRRVIVVGWRDHHCLHMLQQFTDLPEVNKYVYVVNYTRREVTINGGRVSFRSSQYGDFNWQAKVFPGPDSRTPTFVDHHTLEMYDEREAHRAIDAIRATKLADARKGPEPRDRRGEDPQHSRVFSRPVASYTSMVDQGAPISVSCDVSSDAGSSSGGSESSGGSCGAD